MREKIMEAINQQKIVAIIRNVSIKKIEKTVEALYRGGIRLAEVTLNQSDPIAYKEALDSIQLLSEKYKDTLYIGAGTVINKQQLMEVYKVGAKFIISPNVSEDVIRGSRELDLVSIPGALTPSEVVDAMSYGADFVKLFPGGTFGIDYVKALKAPLSQVPILVVGGVNNTNMKDFIDIGVKGFGIGGNLVNKELIDNDQYDKLEELAYSYTNQLSELY